MSDRTTLALLAREHAAESLAQMEKAIHELDALCREVGSPVSGQFDAYRARDAIRIVAALTERLSADMRRIAERSAKEG